MLVVVALVLALWLSYSRFRFGDGVTVEVTPGWDKKIAMLRDFSVVLGVFTPLSLVGLTMFQHLTIPTNRKRSHWGSWDSLFSLST